MPWKPTIPDELVEKILILQGELGVQNKTSALFSLIEKGLPLYLAALRSATNVAVQPIPPPQQPKPLPAPIPEASPQIIEPAKSSKASRLKNL